MFISVVVSVYNIDKLIERCLTTMTQILCDDIEVLLVLRKNDSSGSGTICKQYEREYNNIRLIEQDGVGLSNARNAAMRNARGKYIVFWDGDDYIIPEKFNQVVEVLREGKDFDLYVNDFLMINTEGKIIREQKQIPEGIYGAEYTPNFLKTKGSIWNIWRYIYRKKFLVENHLTFMENSLCEDVDFTTRIFKETDNVRYFHLPYYCYCAVREDSLFNSGAKRYHLDLIKIIYSLIEESSSNELDYLLEKKLVREYILSMAGVYALPRDEKKDVIDEYGRLVNMLKGYGFVEYFMYSSIQILGIKNVIKILFVVKILRRKLIY